MIPEVAPYGTDSKPWAADELVRVNAEPREASTTQVSTMHRHLPDSTLRTLKQGVNQHVTHLSFILKPRHVFFKELSKREGLDLPHCFIWDWNYRGMHKHIILQKGQNRGDFPVLFCNQFLSIVNKHH